MIPQTLRITQRKSNIRSTTRRGVRRRKWPWSFERLEDRTLLATFTVNSLLDTVDAAPGNGSAQDAAGLTTLRAAIMEANALAGNDTIILGAGTYYLTLTGANEDGGVTGDLDIVPNGTLTIVGAGAGQTIISAAGDSASIPALGDRIFHVHSGAELRLEDVAVSGGTANADNFSGGGFLVNGGTLELTDVEVTANHAASQGGAIYNQSGVVTIINSTVSGNDAVGDGGAIYSSGNLNILNSTLSENRSGTPDRFTTGPAGGGAIFNFFSSVTIAGSILSGNVAINRGGGAILTWDGTVNVTDTVFSENTASRGGAIWNRGTFNIHDSILANNIAIGTNSLNTPLGGCGAAIANFAVLAITNCAVTDNVAESNGGAIYNDVTHVIPLSILSIINSTLSRNQANRRGGGIYNGITTTIVPTRSTVTVVNSTLSENVAHGGGGGVFQEHSNADVSIVHSTITGNRATNHSGLGFGGGLNIVNGTASLHNTIVAGNFVGGTSPNDISGSVTGSFNLIGDPNTAGGLTHDPAGSGNLVGDGSGNFLPIESILVTTLANNGGPTFTHGLAPGSPAIHAGDPNFDPLVFNPPLVFDQRGAGFDRVFDGRIDIGATEAQPSTTPPTFTSVPLSVFAEATGADGAVVNFPPATATDDVDDPADIAIAYSHPSGSQFTLGTTTVTVTATDSHGNASSASFDVTVRDTTPPALIVPGDITDEATSPAGAIVMFAATASDAVDAQPTIVHSPASGTLFPVGESTVTVTATDDTGNVGTGSFKVFVIDTSGPVIELPPDQTFEGTSATGAFVIFAEATTPGETTTITYSPANGSQFALGATTVLVTATDNLGNSSTGAFEVFVVDTTAPALTLPGDITAEATGPGGAVVTFAATAIDAVSTPTIVYSHSSGSLFALGETEVTVTATDDVGNQSTGIFTVNVIDAPPTGGVTTVALQNGTLIIEGHDGNEVVSITGIGTGTGVYEVITAQSTQTVSGVIGGISINLGGGNDELVLNNVYVAGAINIQSGDGNDTVVLGHQAVVSSAGELRIDLGGGDDTLDGKRLYIGTNQIINAGDGNDQLIFDGFATPLFTLGTSAAGNANWSTGNGNDTVHIIYAFIVGAFAIDLSVGADSLNIFGSAVSGNVSFFGGIGTDSLTVDTNFLDANLLVDGGADSDTIFLANGLGTDIGTINSGAGADTVTIRNQTTGRLNVDTGTGADNIDVRSSAFDRLFALLGDDNDALAVFGNLTRLETDLDAGAGDADRLIDLGNGFGGAFRSRAFELFS